jgi:hypothetical protein
LFIFSIQTSVYVLIRLTSVWKNTFHTQFFRQFSDEQYPMLIGIMRISIPEMNGSRTSAYQFKLLLKGEKLIRTQKKPDRKTTLDELINYRKEFDINENDPVCSIHFYNIKIDVNIVSF